MAKLLTFLLFLISFAFLINSCSQGKTGQPESLIKQDSIIPPVVVTAGNPITPNPDTCPPPRTIAVPETPGGSYIFKTTGEPIEIELAPPEKKPADFFVTMQNYNTEQGLALSSISCGYRDKEGNLWFGTVGGGVSRYDGKSFTNFTTTQGLSNNNVWGITEDKRGNLWFATIGGGVSRYDGKSFTNFTTAQGLSDNKVWSIKEDKKGNLWFGTVGGVSRYNGKSFTNFTTAQGLSNNYVWCIAEDKKGNLWFGTNGGGVNKYDGKSFTSFTSAQGLTNDNVYSIAEDKKGNLWFGTDRGVSKYDGKSFTNFTTEQGFSDNKVWSIKEDRAGNLWFGTNSEGVIRYDVKSFVSFTAAQGLSNNKVYCITEDKKGNLWFGTDRGVSKYDGKFFTNFTTAQGFSDNTIFGIIEDKKGNLWFATSGDGVSRYNGQSFTNYTEAQGLSNNKVYCITEDKKGNLWFGTDGGGVSRYDGKSFINFTKKQGLVDNRVSCIAEDKAGNLWFGSTGAGVSRYDGKSFTNFTTVQGLSNNTIYCITEDKSGNIWFGTDGGGVSVLRNRSQEAPEANNEKTNAADGNKMTFENFTTNEGLADDIVYDVVEDSSGNIIIGTNLGITVLKGGLGTSGQSFAKEGLEYYNQKTGYPVKDINNNAMYVDRKGLIWIGTGGEKLVRFDYSAIHKDTAAPNVFIQSIKINNENICWYDLLASGRDGRSELKADSNTIAPNITEEAIIFDKALTAAQRDAMRKKFGDVKFDSITPFYSIPENLVLPFKHNNVTFDFAALETGKSFLVRYQYILEGYDHDWSPVANKTSATFGNIHEGTYTFSLKAQSPDGVWSKPIQYSFTVLPPWYRAWWMYVIYAFIILMSIVLIFRWRTGALRKEKEILEEKVEIRTSELRKEKDRSESLLLNILPAETAEELKKTGTAKAKDFNEVTVLFTDFKNFSIMSEHLNAQELVSEINFCYSAFDNIISRYGIEKIKTIGDSYMCAGGLPVEKKTNPEDTLMAAIEIRDFMILEKERRAAQGKTFFEIRIGLHTGPVVAGIVGIKKFAYDIWGDAVNIASRMESSGEPGKVNISGSTYDLVKEKFICTYRGKVEAKNKGEIDMYFVERIKTT